MRKIINFVLIIPLLFLTGCFKERSPEVTAVAISYSTKSDNYGKTEIYLKWLSEDGDRFCIRTGEGWRGDDLALSLLKIKPGKYYLTSYSASKNSVSIKNSKDFVFAWFEIKPGEAFYIGHLNIDIDEDDMLRINLEDKFNSVQNSVRNCIGYSPNMSDIGKKIINKPMIFEKISIDIY